MPFEHYGVLAGTLTHHFRDQPDNQGRWFHVNLRVAAGSGTYRCAVDVDSKASAVGVEWKVLVVPKELIAPVGDLSPGYHELRREQGAGALDHIRHPAGHDDPWISGSYAEASTALESVLAVGRKAMVWGEPFTTGLGMHNIHQNQGDPAGSQWWDENGIWQDGATVVERADGAYDAFLSKFSTQAAQTDENGHPAGNPETCG